MKALSGLVLLALCIVATGGCARSKPEPAPSAAASSSGRDAPRTIRLAPGVIADAKIKTATTIKEVLVGTIDLTGEITTDPDKTARISSPVAGRIEQVSFKEGTPVKKGDALAVIRVPELGKIRSAYASTVAKAKAARLGAERLKNLRAQGLSGEQEYLNAEAEAQSMEAEVRALGEQLGAMGMASSAQGALLTLRAPLSGIVVSRNALVGQPINVDEMMGTIADLSEVWFLGRIFERSLSQLELGAKANVTLDAFPAVTFGGTVSFIGNQIDPSSRTLTARIQIANPKSLLRIGLFGTAHILAADDSKKPPSVVIPRTAIVDLGGKQVVFIRRPSGEFEVSEVVVGDSSSDRVEIRSGLDEGQEIVVDGSFTIKSTLLKSSFAGEE